MSQPDTRVRELCDRLESICRRADEMELALAPELAMVHPKLQDSARNLVHYIALRNTDIRHLQRQLEELGLSSLGRAERHTKSSIQSVLKVLRRLHSDEGYDLAGERQDFLRSDAALSEHARDLLGSISRGRMTRIMVTLSQATASSYEGICDLIDAGMDVARINTAHDDRDTWLGMIDNIRRANEAKGTACKIVMDLAGPKIRTGQLKPGPCVKRLRPKRDALGRVLAPRRLRLVSDENGARTLRGSTLPVSASCIDYVRSGDELRFHDTRGKKRKLKVVGKDHKGLIVEISKTAYIASGTKLKIKRSETGEKQTFRIGALPSIEQPLLLRIGDTLILHRRSDPGEPVAINGKGRVTRAAHIACTPAGVFCYLSPGALIRLNDGKIEGIVRAVDADELTVEVTHAKATGSRLRGGKGINFPNSDIQPIVSTGADKKNLPFIVSHADMVGLSFVRESTDVTALQDKLQSLPDARQGIILKIETEPAFHHLPRLLLTAMRSYPVGVMIARGDLAVECGWERLAEIQEEILWLCEAARLPVIWATQVLEQETKKGRPSRAEITDAAMAQRADCVMLNKGPHIIKAICMLDNILKRMQGHQRKKSPMLRKLSISDIGASRAPG